MTSRNKLLFLGALFLAALLFYFRKDKPSAQEAEAPGKPIRFVPPTPTIPRPAQVVVNGIPTKNNQAAQAQMELTKALSPDDKKLFEIFTQIMISKNDNDPRLDKELRHLSPELKKTLQREYALLPDERRNEKGLIVFLIARDVSVPEDLQFLESVYQESPCLSLANCQVRGPEDPHFSGINEVSLVYPQIAGLFQLETQLKARPELLNEPGFKNEMSQLIRVAERFPVPAVQKRADDLKNKYGL
jgi:hypothetical protein